MNALAMLFVAAVLTAAASKPDPIDTWVAQLNADPTWGNGKSPDLELPSTATTEQVVAKVFAMTGFPQHIKNFQILETRKVQIKGSLPDLYTAVLTKTERGEIVVLLQYYGGWRSEVLEVPQS